LKPSVPHPGLFPIVISLKASRPLLYNKGLRKPREGKPLARRASFKRATTAAKVGDEAEEEMSVLVVIRKRETDVPLVPPMDIGWPDTNTLKRRPWAATSGAA
jgi:hypothetical protein